MIQSHTLSWLWCTLRVSVGDLVLELVPEAEEEVVHPLIWLVKGGDEVCSIGWSKN